MKQTRSYKTLSILGSSIFLVALLGGCASTEETRKAQATADQAMVRADEANANGWISAVDTHSATSSSKHPEEAYLLSYAMAVATFWIAGRMVFAAPVDSGASAPPPATFDIRDGARVIRPGQPEQLVREWLP